MYAFLKRSIDIFLALIFMILASPVLAIIGLAIVVSDGWPVFFRQTRIGLHGKPFVIWKFRTLRTNHTELTDPQAGVTRVGRFLRRWGLDELPQLWNVIKGDMSLIGPRPTIPEQVARYGSYEKQRLTMRPGLTGWAQIHGRNAIDWTKRIELDIVYVRRASLFFDLAILIRTPFSLFSKTGTYGPEGVNPDFIPAPEA